MTQKDYILKILKTLIFQLGAGLLVIGFIYNVVKTKDNEYTRAQRLDFPGTTELTLNRSFQRFQLQKDSSEIHIDLIKNLHDKNLKLVSAIYADHKKNIRLAVTQSNENQLLLTIIKNNQVTQVQRINEINEKKIILQYGSMHLNSNILAQATESADIL